MHIIIDGIDGSGKGTLLEYIKEFFLDKGQKIFDVTDYWKTYGKHPEIEQILLSDVIFTSEPTYVEKGYEIRNKLIKTGTKATPEEIAMAFAEDRLSHYNNVILPAIKANKIIIQDRGISTTLSYQTLSSPNITIQWLLGLEGNRLAIEHAPNYLILADIKVDTALLRLNLRSDKQDGAIFEKKPILEKFTKNFKDSNYRKNFTDHGTKIIDFSTEVSRDIMKKNILSILEQLL